MIDAAYNGSSGSGEGENDNSEDEGGNPSGSVIRV